MCRNYSCGNVSHWLLCSWNWQSLLAIQRAWRYCYFLCISILLNTIVGDILWATYQIKIYSEWSSLHSNKDLKWLYLNRWPINFTFEWHAIEPVFTNAILWMNQKSYQKLEIISKAMDLFNTLNYWAIVNMPEI